MRRREALRSAGSLAALGLLGSLAGCQTTPEPAPSADGASTVTPAAVPTETTPSVPADESQSRRTVVRSLYVPTVDRLRAMERLDVTTVGDEGGGDGSAVGDDEDGATTASAGEAADEDDPTAPAPPHALALVNESVSRWRFTVRIGRADPGGTRLSTTVTTPPRSYVVYALPPPASYEVRIAGEDVAVEDDPVDDAFVVSDDWFGRAGAVTVAGITLDGYWQGTLLNRPLYDELLAE
ncbi:hypothetical protein [Halomarina rubra]|uniref:Uncharacterized protein n=1 Tax=Halomarina rubra TaxID=2071873 RepID=A0ABD6B133_9EURY|nr:hypothetical protein [Halomarina rubra]